MLSKNMKNFIKLNEITKDYIFNFLNENNLIGKYIDILYIKPNAVKYYFNTINIFLQYPILEIFHYKKQISFLIHL